MSDDALRAAQRRWRSDPTPENAFLWARLYDRTLHLAVTISAVFGERDRKGKRVLQCISRVMSLIHGNNGVGDLPISEVARISEQQWRSVGLCGDATIREIKTALESNGMAISPIDDQQLMATNSAMVMDRAWLTARAAQAEDNAAVFADQRDHARLERDQVRRDLDRALANHRADMARVLAERDSALRRIELLTNRAYGVGREDSRRDEPVDVDGTLWASGLPPTG